MYRDLKDVREVEWGHLSWNKREADIMPFTMLMLINGQQENFI